MESRSRAIAATVVRVAGFPSQTFDPGQGAATRSSKAQYLPDPAVGPTNREQDHPPKEDLNEVRPDRGARPRSFARSIRKSQAPLRRRRWIGDLRRRHEEAVQEAWREVDEDEGLQHDQVALEPREAAR